MLISDHIAVIFKPTGTGHDMVSKMVLNPQQWAQLQRLAQEGTFVILEAWQMGKCISN